MWRLWLLAGVLMAGCSESEPDLHWLYSDAREARVPPPVIVVPGIMGSRLTEPEGGEEVWPGGWGRLLFSDYADLALPLPGKPHTDALQVTGLFDGVAGRDFYGRIMRTLEDAAGYQRTEPGTPVGSPAARYYVLAYDWRQDNVTTARRLHALIEQIRADHQDPSLKVDVIAHSMGGLVLRYYLRYGTMDVLDGNDFPVNGMGAERIHRLILLGTPNLGSITAMTSLLEGQRVGFGRVPAEVMLSFPSVYQLMPHALTPWLVTETGKPLSRDQFDAYIWKRFQIGPWDPGLKARLSDDHLLALQQASEGYLERARRFSWSLTVAAPEGKTEIYPFGGDCHPTPSRFLVEEVKGVSHLRLWPDDIRHRQPGRDYQRWMLEPGDGVVSKSSLLARNVLNPALPRHPHIHFPARSAFFLCERHDRLTGNLNFQDNLLHVLLSADF
jgi:pimeloyl-ACP methyl ester carboxylesterase